MRLGGNSSVSRERSIVVLVISLVVAVTTCGLFAQAAAANYYGIDNLYGSSFGGATGSLRTALGQPRTGDHGFVGRRGPSQR